MRVYECYAEVSSKELEYYQDILDRDASFFEDEGEEFPIDATLFSVTGTFENGWSATYEVFTGEVSVMSSCYLFNENGESITYDADDCSIVGTTEFNINGEEKYIFVIHEEGSTPIRALK